VTTSAQIRWLNSQPLQIQLAAVEKVWQGRADKMVLIADQLSAVGKSHQAMDVVVDFADRAACSCERVNKDSEFGSFARERIRRIAGNAIVKTAVVSHVATGATNGLDTEALIQVCDRLGVSI